MVQASVFSMRQEHQVSGGFVVQGIVVLVMDMLAVQQGAADQALHDNPVFVAPNIRISDLDPPINKSSTTLMFVAGTDRKISGVLRSFPPFTLMASGICDNAFAGTAAPGVVKGFSIAAPLAFYFSIAEGAVFVL